MNVEPFRLEAGEAADDGLKLVPHLVEIIQSFPDAKIVKVVGTQFVAQKVRSFSYCLRKALLKNARNTWWPWSI